MEYAYINRQILRWARERRGFSKDAFATKLKVTSQQVTQWETGPEFPPFGRAQHIANALEIPFGYFFLSLPPTEKPAIPDLRRVGAGQLPPSPDFIDLLNDVVVKHDWYAAYSKENAAPKLPFVGSRSVNTPPLRTVQSIRDVIGTKELRKECTGPSDYLRVLCQRAEDAGILTMRAGVVRGNTRRKLSVAEFRGFAISNQIAPLVFINSTDAVAAQVFTFAHELAHIWIGQSGISNPELAQRTKTITEIDVIEEYCNMVAAEFLVPATDFEQAWMAIRADSDNKAISLSRSFRVSVPVILRRALELNHLGQNEFFNLWNIHKARTKAAENTRKEEESGGGNFYNTFFARNSRKLSQAVVSVVRAGQMGTLEAARLLNVHTTTIPKLAARLAI
jgi:Zn-dependent peptidase ImmA (M78 family)/transcriptional regulator with XRE-family HTH domain